MDIGISFKMEVLLAPSMYKDGRLTIKGMCRIPASKAPEKHGSAKFANLHY